MTDLVTLNLVDENSQAQIQYYSDLTLDDLAGYLDQQGAKSRGTYYFCSPYNGTVYSLSSVIGDLLSGEMQLTLELQNSTTMNVTLKFDEYTDQILPFMPDDTIRQIKQDLSDNFNSPPSSFKIKFGDNECDNDEVLYNIGIRDGSEIHVEITSNTIHLSIRAPEHTVPIETDADSTFEQIQQEVTNGLHLEKSHLTLTDPQGIPVQPLCTIKQYLEEHPELSQPYIFNAAIELLGGIFKSILES